VCAREWDCVDKQQQGVIVWGSQAGAGVTAGLQAIVREGSDVPAAPAAAAAA
jgi:hypothetical protein